MFRLNYVSTLTSQDPTSEHFRYLRALEVASENPAHGKKGVSNPSNDTTWTTNDSLKQRALLIFLYTFSGPRCITQSREMELLSPNFPWNLALESSLRDRVHLMSSLHGSP